MDDDRNHDDLDHHRGLAFDLSTMLDRRRVLKMVAGAGLVTLVGCGKDSKTASTTSTSAAASSTTGAPATTAAVAVTDCSTIPEETGGPFPGDGSNGPDALSQSGIVRSDIRSSFGSSSTVAAGVPLTIVLTVLDTSDCKAKSGAAVYLWHCNIDGGYSMYGQGITNENYLRGVQEADANGTVTFTSIFPAAYSGRWPHIHFEIYPSVAAATGSGTKLVTSQLALPEDACNLVYATSGYSRSVGNLAQTSLARDMVFSDGYATQLATVTGDVTSGFVARLNVGV